MKKKIIVHIGLAKCASTSLQKELYKSENIDFAGLLPIHQAGIYWKKNTLSELFDVDLRFNASQVEKYKESIANYIKESTKKTVVFSSENLSIRFLSWDVPTHFKLNALKEIFPKDTTFIFLYKSPIKIILSLYKEWVMLGYSRTFTTFCNEVYSLKSLSFYNDLLMNRQTLLIKNKLKCSHVLLLEDKNINSKLSALFNTKINIHNSAENQSLSEQQIECIRKYNMTENDFNSFFDILELHRINSSDSDEIKYSTARKRNIRKELVTKKNLIPSVISKWVVPVKIKSDILKDLNNIDTSKILAEECEIIKKYKEECNA